MTAGLSHGPFKAISHKFHCKRPFKKPLEKGRKGLLRRSLSWKPCEQQTKGNQIYLAEPWKAWETWSIHNVTYNEVQQPNKQTFQPRRKINQYKEFLYWPHELDSGSQVSELCKRGCSSWGHLKHRLIVLGWSDCWFFFFLECDFLVG